MLMIYVLMLNMLHSMIEQHASGKIILTKVLLCAFVQEIHQLILLMHGGGGEGGGGGGGDGGLGQYANKSLPEK